MINSVNCKKVPPKVPQKIRLFKLEKMKKEGLNTGFTLKKRQEIGCTNSIPALGTSNP